MELEALSLRERAGQLIWPRLGSNMQPLVSAEDDAERVRQLVETYAVGGLIVFNAHWPSCCNLLEELQDESRLPLLIASDIERGMGQQFEGLTLFPHAQAFDRGNGSTSQVASFARITAREASAAGVHLAFAPVTDVDLHEQNPIISTRAFSKEPREAARLVRAFIDEAEACGLLTTAKHFPGHGRTSTDSHDTVPVVGVSREDLEHTDLLPFREAIQAGVSCVMTSHVAFPSLDDSGLPATRSAAILRKLLREEMAFQGVVVSDSLLMEGAKQEGRPLADQIASLINAGVDVLLDVSDPGAASTALLRAVLEGKVEEEVLNEATQRVLALKRKAGLFKDGQRSRKPLDLPQHRRLAGRIAQDALFPNQALQDVGLPLQLSSVIFMPTASAAFTEGPPLFEAIRQSDVSPQEITWGPDDGAVREITGIQSDGFVLVVLAGGPAAWRASHLTEAQEQMLTQLLNVPRIIVAALGPPSLLKDVPDHVPTLCAYSDVPDAHAALISYLLSN